MIIEYMLLLLPGLISVAIFKMLNKEKVKGYSYIEWYAVFSFAIYFLCTAFMYMRKITDYTIRTLALKDQIIYGIIDFCFAVILPFALYFGKSFGKYILIDKKER